MKSIADDNLIWPASIVALTIIGTVTIAFLLLLHPAFAESETALAPKLPRPKTVVVLQAEGAQIYERKVDGMGRRAWRSRTSCEMGAFASITCAAD